MNESEFPEQEVKILLVDDEVNITRSLRRLLIDFDNYQVFIAHSGHEALAILHEEPDCGIIVSDQRMPGMTGVEFLNAAKDLVPKAIRILLTGYADIEASIAAINKGGVFRYLTKPWDDEHLIEVIAEAASSFCLVRENERLNRLVLKQKKELEDWNKRLKQRVLEQTSQIRAKSDALAESHQQLKESFGATIDAMTGLIELHQERAPGHSRNVSELSRAIAEQMGLENKITDQVASAGLLHDIGKIGISENILSKGIADMTAMEFVAYKTHVVRGQAAIDRIPELRDIGVMVRNHHERYDGRGFPDRFSGRDIPLGARIVSAADMFEHRLQAFPEDEALDEALNSLQGEWGNSLDPELRAALEKGAREIYDSLDFQCEIKEMTVSPRGLKVGMQLKNDLYSGTGVLLLKGGSVFDDRAIDAVKRCFQIDPFEKDIKVLVRASDSE